MPGNRSISNLSRNFVIPAGTQVVLRADTAIAPLVHDEASETSAGDSEPAVTRADHSPTHSGFKKAGSVGVVIKCPSHNDLPYSVRFTDGAIVDVSFDEIVLRRQEIENLLIDEQTDFRPFIIYRCQVGSKAFGLATEDSDDDYRGIFLPPARQHWSMFKIPEQIESKNGQEDEVYWELEKFLRLALKANPNILETLWTPMVIQADPIAVHLRRIRQSFLSKHIFKTYSGYVLSQFRRMKNSFEKTNHYKPKHAMHLIRLLYSGIGALRTGEIMIDVSEHRDHLMQVRNGELSFDEVRQQALALDREFQSVFETTNLPEQPDFSAVDQFLIEARQSMVDTMSS